MELWIRSQDKRKLLKVKSIFLENIYYEDGSINIMGDNFILGRYKEERALSILDEIEKILNPIVIYKQPKFSDFSIQDLAQDAILQMNQKVEMDLKQAGQIVYQMPEE